MQAGGFVVVPIPLALARGGLRRGLTRYALFLAATTLTLVMRVTDAAGADLKALAAMLTPAYTAMDFAAVCAQDDPTFINATSGQLGTAFHYAEHVKNEVIESLSSEESKEVLRIAADAARSVARREIRERAPDYPKARPGEITAWCHNEAASFVRSFIQQHDTYHEILLRDLEQAKR